MKMLQQCPVVFEVTRITVHVHRNIPVQMAVVFKVFCPMASFDIFDDMGLEELSKQLQSLIAGHLRPKVVVAP